MVRHMIAPAIMICALMLLPTAPANASGPGFDCAKATRQIDKAICAWDTVGSLDGRMARAYKKATAAHNDEAAIASVKADQKAWLSERDRRCALKTVKPKEGSEDGLSPQQFGQLMCLQFIYPPRIAQLMDLAAPPLVPLNVKMVPIEPLKAAYPDDWRQPGYEAAFSPDKTLMALGVEDSAGYVKQVWLYQPASGRLAVASPQTNGDRTDTPKDISELNFWIWGDDGRFYVRARRPLGEDSVFGADMDGYAEMRELPADVVAKIAAQEAAQKAAIYDPNAPKPKQPPGFNDNSYNKQDSGSFSTWAQNKGHGSFDLMAARDGDEEPRIIASGGWEIENFQFDPSGTRLFYNGEEGVVVTNPDTQATRRLKGTRGGALEVRPINMSVDGAILIYWASGTCMSDAADEMDPDTDDDSIRRVCLAYLEAAGNAPTPKPVSETLPGKTDAAPADPWVGKWEGRDNGSLSATIRRGVAKPDYLVIDLVAGIPGCSGAVTLYGKPKANAVLGESYDLNNRGIPVCRIALSLDGKGVLTTEVVGPCTFYHGASCGFDGSMTRSK